MCIIYNFVPIHIGLHITRHIKENEKRDVEFDLQKKKKMFRYNFI